MNRATTAPTGKARPARGGSFNNYLLLALVCLVFGAYLGRVLERRSNPEAEKRLVLKKQQQVIQATIAALEVYQQMLTNVPAENP